MVRLIFIVVLVLLQALVGIPDVLTDGSYWQRAFSYSFFHGNWWHLAVNCLACWTIFQPKYKLTPLQLVTAYAIAVIVYPLSLRPVIGFSNVLYAILGLRTPSLKSKWWRQTPVIVFLVVTIGLVFVPQFSATTHIASFLLGMSVAALKRFYYVLTDDCRRYL